MGEMRGRERQSEVTAENRCLGLWVGGSSRRSELGVRSSKNSRRHRDRCDRCVGKACSSYRASSTSGGAGSSRRCTGEASEGGFPADELQEYPVSCWLDTMNIGVSCEDDA